MKGNKSHIKQATLSESSRRLLEANEEYERELWRAARNYQQLEHYDYSLFGLDPNLDQAVGLHQREAMLYNQGEFRIDGGRASERASKRAINPLLVLFS